MKPYYARKGKYKDGRGRVVIVRKVGKHSRTKALPRPEKLWLNPNKSFSDKEDTIPEDLKKRVIELEKSTRHRFHLFIKRYSKGIVRYNEKTNKRLDKMEKEIKIIWLNIVKLNDEVNTLK